MKKLKEIDRLVARLFRERWTNLHAPDALAGTDLKFPGVYLIAYTGSAIVGARVKPRDVFYVGMSNARSGVRGRLRQFTIGIESGAMHSGAVRFFRLYGRERPFSKARARKRIYFAALTLPCVSDKAAAKADDLRIMGHVACLEYYAIAHVAARTGRKPALNKLGAADAVEGGTGSARRRKGRARSLRRQ